MDVRKTLKQVGLRPKKRLGQHFLQDDAVLDDILSAAAVGPTETVLEIGAGLGVLTGVLCRQAGRVIALEVDPDLFAYLSLQFRDRDNLRILLEDILDYDLRDLPAQGTKVVGNLPYYISTPVLMHLLHFASRFSGIVLMFQKELAERIVAPPGSRTYGSLSIAVQCYSEPEILSVVPRTAFYPVPEVDSALVRLGIPETPRLRVPRPEAFFTLVRAAFSQRRKTLRNALLGSGRFAPGALDHALEAAGILPGRRAETLSIEEFARLSEILL